MGKEDRHLYIYEKYKLIIFQTANSILHDSYLAEDVLQETFLIASRENMELNQEMLEATGWFITVARNLAINVYNRRKREVFIISDSEYDNFIFSNKKDILEEISEQNNYHKLVNTIDQLGDGYSEILTLKYLQHYNYQEIADMKSINCGTARKRVQRAKDKLWKLLDESKE
jgi:RNA polymerase sigma factor, sigma-70 family